MFKKFGLSKLGLSKGGKGAKYKLEVQIVSVDGMPDAVKKCRVVMSRAAKVAMTDVKDTRNGTLATAAGAMLTLLLPCGHVPYGRANALSQPPCSSEPASSALRHTTEHDPIPLPCHSGSAMQRIPTPPICQSAMPFRLSHATEVDPSAMQLKPTPLLCHAVQAPQCSNSY